MTITITQIFLALFLIFALSRVILRFRGGDLSVFSFSFWFCLFGFATIVILFPGVTGGFARMFGVGRGADIVVYISVAVLFYLVFRIYIYLEDIKHDITEIVQKIAMKDLKEKNGKKTTHH
jgi:hypothetical protein